MKEFVASLGGTAIISSLVLAGGHPLFIIVGYAGGAFAVCLLLNYIRSRSRPATISNDKIHR